MGYRLLFSCDPPQKRGIFRVVIAYLKLFTSANVISLQRAAMSKVYSLKEVQIIPITLQQAWDYFSKPANLKDITPANLGFAIRSKYHGALCTRAR
jgi:hypothetical protein